MGSSSSKCTTRQEPCRQEAERPSSKTSEFCIIGSSSSEGSNAKQVSARDQCPRSSNSDTREALEGSQQPVKQEASRFSEIRERRAHQPPRLSSSISRTRELYTDPLAGLSSGQSEMVNEENPRILCRTMHVNADSLTRLPSRHAERPREVGRGQYRIEEIQARLRSYTGSSSSYMDTAYRMRQQGSDSISQTSTNDLTSVERTNRYNINSAFSSLSQGERARSLPLYGEIDGGYSVGDMPSNTHFTRPVASSGSSHYPDLRGSSTLRGELTGRESRRNGGRRFWDAFTRATSHRRPSNYQESHDIIRRVICANNQAAMSNRRVDTTAQPYGQREGRNAFRHNRSLNLDERRRRFRSQVWALQRLSSNLESVPGHPRPCGRSVRQEPVEQPHATTRSTEETNTRASISRIIMLAEALFQVLDEIHRQSLALSQSSGLSLGARRAPDAVVESIPLRVFRKADTQENKEEAALQCHICLLEYEEGDQLRVLPCTHEYHMTCIDKWLREAHRVCPLCRGDVCELTATEK